MAARFGEQWRRDLEPGDGGSCGHARSSTTTRPHVPTPNPALPTTFPTRPQDEGELRALYLAAGDRAAVAATCMKNCSSWLPPIALRWPRPAGDAATSPPATPVYRRPYSWPVDQAASPSGAPLATPLWPGWEGIREAYGCGGAAICWAEASGGVTGTAQWSLGQGQPVAVWFLPRWILERLLSLFPRFGFASLFEEGDQVYVDFLT